jgi:hypothetical protein
LAWSGRSARASLAEPRGRTRLRSAQLRRASPERALRALGHRWPVAGAAGKTRFPTHGVWRPHKTRNLEATLPSSGRVPLVAPEPSASLDSRVCSPLGEQLSVANARRACIKGWRRGWGYVRSPAARRAPVFAHTFRSKRSPRRRPAPTALARRLHQETLEVRLAESGEPFPPRQNPQPCGGSAARVEAPAPLASCACPEPVACPPHPPAERAGASRTRASHGPRSQRGTAINPPVPAGLRQRRPAAPRHHTRIEPPADRLGPAATPGTPTPSRTRSVHPSLRRAALRAPPPASTIAPPRLHNPAPMASPAGSGPLFYPLTYPRPSPEQVCIAWGGPLPTRAGVRGAVFRQRHL